MTVISAEVAHHVASTVITTQVRFACSETLMHTATRDIMVTETEACIVVMNFLLALSSNRFDYLNRQNFFMISIQKTTFVKNRFRFFRGQRYEDEYVQICNIEETKELENKMFLGVYIKNSIAKRIQISTWINQYDGNVGINNRFALRRSENDIVKSITS